MVDEVFKVVVVVELFLLVIVEEGLGGGFIDGVDGGRFFCYMGFWNFLFFYFVV